MPGDQFGVVDGHGLVRAAMTATTTRGELGSAGLKPCIVTVTRLKNSMADQLRTWGGGDDPRPPTLRCDRWPRDASPTATL